MPAAFAQDTGSFIVRARAVHLDSADKDSTGLGLTMNNKTIPDGRSTPGTRQRNDATIDLLKTAAR